MLRAMSARVTMNEQPPEQGITHSSRCSGSATMRELTTSSVVSGLS